MDVDRFTKLMMLTTSDSDGEAVNALRVANKMLRAGGLNWEAFIAGRSQRDDARALRQENVKLRNELITLRDEVMRLRSQVNARADRDTHEDTSIREMIDHCLLHVHGSAYDFICSLADAYDKWGRLTPRQKAALTKFYRNCA